MKIFVTALVVAATMTGGSAMAQEHKNQIKARQGQFWTLAINLGVLGSMAKGEVEYSAEAAQAAADSIKGVSMVNMATLFPEGSDNMMVDGTRAQPTIWEQNDDFLAKWAALGEAATNASANAGNGQEALGPILGALGGTCKACHEAHRAPAN